MKRCSFIVCFALIIVLAMPMTVSAYDESGFVDVTAAGWTNENGVFYAFNDDILNYLETNSVKYMIFKEATNTHYYNGLNNYSCDRYSIIFWDDSLVNLVVSSYKTSNSGSEKVDGSGFYGFEAIKKDGSLGTFAIASFYFNQNDSVLQYESFTSSQSEFISKEYNSLDNFYGYRLLKSAGDIYLSDGSLFFQAPEMPKISVVVTAVTPVKMEAVMTEVVKILPIGLACLVGWIGLRKGLSLLRQVLFPA